MMSITGFIFEIFILSFTDFRKVFISRLRRVLTVIILDWVAPHLSAEVKEGLKWPSNGCKDGRRTVAVLDVIKTNLLFE